MARTPTERRPKLSITVDPALLREVDEFIAQHPGTDRSKVIDDALMLWYGREQRRAIVRQYEAIPTPEQQAETDDWQAIRDSSFEDLFDEHREGAA